MLSSKGTPTPPQSYLPGLNWLWAALLLLSPVLNPWYLAWWLPLATLAPSRTAWVASFAVMLSYVTGLNLADSSLQAYEQPPWVFALEFGAILLALWLDWKTPLTRQTQTVQASGPVH